MPRLVLRHAARLPSLYIASWLLLACSDADQQSAANDRELGHLHESDEQALCAWQRERTDAHYERYPLERTCTMLGILFATDAHDGQPASTAPFAQICADQRDQCLARYQPQPSCPAFTDCALTVDEYKHCVAQTFDYLAERAEYPRNLPSCDQAKPDDAIPLLPALSGATLPPCVAEQRALCPNHSKHRAPALNSRGTFAIFSPRYQPPR